MHRIRLGRDASAMLLAEGICPGAIGHTRSLMALLDSAGVVTILRPHRLPLPAAVRDAWGEGGLTGGSVVPFASCSARPPPGPRTPCYRPRGREGRAPATGDNSQRKAGDHLRSLRAAASCVAGEKFLNYYASHHRHALCGSFDWKAPRIRRVAGPKSCR